MNDAQRWPIYPAREDTYLLLPFAAAEPGELVAEVGCGNGLLALTAARSGARVVATDRNPMALRALRQRAQRERLDLQPVRTDLLAGLGRFDRILANPPYLPTPPGSSDPLLGDRLALDGGDDGLSVTRRLFETLFEHLTARGRAYVLTSSLQDPGGLARVINEWKQRGGLAEVVAGRELEGERLEVLACRVSSQSPLPGRNAD